MTPDQFRSRRMALGLTCSQCASPLGVSPDDIIRWERGTPPVPSAFLLALAAAYVELHYEALRRAERRHAKRQASAVQLEAR